jgi:hypothetical protein
MNVVAGITLTHQAEEYLSALAEELEIPESRYDQAVESYKSLGAWFHRPASTVRDLGPDVFVQGSFRLGTAIRPLNEAEQYDVDSVCELKKLSKSHVTQSELKELLGDEIKAYRVAKNMAKPVRPGRRCWVLEYADGAQFHMDIVPALSNAKGQRLLLEARGLDTRWAGTAIAITDNEERNYFIRSEDWPRSNPRGYAEWFRGRMAGVFEKRRRTLAESRRASVESIPDYKVRTPLQSAIMILKRHRDIMFNGRSDVRPISIIITTLAAHAYNGEETIGRALVSILGRMDQFVGHDGKKFIIWNPTDPLENFADKWEEHPERAEAFQQWLSRARNDFQQAAAIATSNAVADRLASGMGRLLTEKAEARSAQRQYSRPALLRSPSAASATPLAFPQEPRIPTKPQGFA